jgi:hypothetical protein
MKKFLPLIVFSLLSVCCLLAQGKHQPVRFGGNKLAAVNKTNYQARLLMQDAPPDQQGQGLECIGDSTIKFIWDTLSNSWKNKIKWSYTFDANSNKTSETIRYWDGTAWIDSAWWVERTTYDYDANNRLISEIWEIWDGSAWQYPSRWTYTYDANGNETIVLDEGLEGGVWVSYRLATSNYDASNNLIGKLIQHWDTSGTLQNFERRTHSYDTHNNRTLDLEERWNDSAWQNTARTTFAFDTTNNQTSMANEVWRDTVWVNSVRYNFTYNTSDNNTYRAIQHWYDTVYQDIVRVWLYYDGNNNNTSSFTSAWNGTAWVNSDSATLTYDVNNNLLDFSRVNWDGNGWVAVSRNSMTYDANSFLRSYTEVGGNGTWTGDSTYYYSCHAPISCSAHFTIYPDTTTPHLWYVIKQTTGTGALNYLWDWGDGSTSTGATPSHVYSSASYYNICLSITDSTGCTATFCDSSTYIYKTEAAAITINVVEQLPTGIEEAIAEATISVYPNPATNQLNINLKGLQADQISIYNIDGKLLSNVKQPANNQRDISDLSAGLYFAEIRVKDFVKRARWIKM